VVLAAGFESVQLLAVLATGDAAKPTLNLPLQPVRGQIAWGKCLASAEMPPFPVNGHGSFIPAFRGVEGQMHWLMGSTFERDSQSGVTTPEDQLALANRLQILLPQTAEALEVAFKADQVKAWAGVRCASPDRLPVVGPLNERTLPGLSICTALGSRGLTFAVLCAELLASWLHAEPLPIEQKLAQALRAERFSKP
jgi:tRNA 5-methylaminomethyl-2-thiouridine biosynthesis bifunctional protein